MSNYARVIADLQLSNRSQPAAERLLFVALWVANQLSDPPTDGNPYRSALALLEPLFAGSNFFDDVREILRRGIESR